MVTPDEIERYLNGNCTETESKKIEDWYHSFEENPDYVSGLEPEKLAELKTKLQAAIRKKILEKETVATAGRLRVLRLVKIAASLVIALGLGYLAREYVFRESTTVNSSAKDGVQLVENTLQRLQKLTLPDTSIIWLYPGASVEYAPFDGDRREIRLVGKAFFDVKRDTLRPFLIHSDNLTTRVLGTSFEITAWPGDSTASVLVKTGTVAVTANTVAAAAPQGDNKVILTSSQKAVFSKESNKLIKEKEISRPEMKIWTSRSLSFHNTPLDEVAGVLSSQFGVEIDIDDKRMGNCTIRADFTDQYLPTIIELICKSVAAEYTILDNRILISGEGCDISDNPNQPIEKETI